MAGVLTTTSTVSCGHGGSVSTQGQRKLRAQGNPVLRQDGILSRSIPDCATVPDPNTTTVKCLTVTSVTAGLATKLKVGGAPVALDTLAGGTSGTVSGTPQNLLSGIAGQTKLTAV
jgi:hypothetical protein